MTEQVGEHAGPENENPQVAEVVTEAPKDEPKAETTEKTEVKAEVPQETVKEPKRNGFTRKIEKLQAEIQALKAQTPAPQPKEAEAAPKPEDFQTWDDYYGAKARFEAKQLLRQELEAERNKAREEQLRGEQQKLVADFQNKAREFSKSVPDFEDAIAEAEISKALEQAVLESDIGPQLAYHLAKNPDVLDELNTLTYGQVARRLGRLEAKLTESPKAEVKTTQAPPPIKPVGSSSVGKYDAYSSKGDDHDAYMRWREAQR